MSYLLDCMPGPFAAILMNMAFGAQFSNDMCEYFHQVYSFSKTIVVVPNLRHNLFALVDA